MEVVTTISKRYLLMKELRDLLNREFPNDQWKMTVYHDEVKVTASRKLTEVEIESNTGMETERDRLWKAIASRRRKSVSGKYFVTDCDLRAIFHDEQIAKAISELGYPANEYPEVVSKIIRQGTKTFAILLWMRRESSIVDFIEHDALDLSLPLDEGRAHLIAPPFGKAFAQEFQWQFLPRYFPADMRHHHLKIRSEEILPFLSEKHIGHGGFGDVFCTGVDALQQQLIPITSENKGDTRPATVVVVVKRMKVIPRRSVETAENAFREEMKCLKLLHRLQHPNIVPLLGSYTYNNENNLLFPHIDMDLEHFLSVEGRFADFERDQTFFYALHGLASALSSVHNLKLNKNDHEIELARIGYHHDFRPANILVSPRTFLLADFGLAKMKKEEMGSHTRYKAGGGDYIAPECMAKDFTRQQIGRAADVWSYGCTVAEVATYMEQGANGVRTFRQQRVGWGFDSQCEDHYFFSSGVLKPQVKPWFRELLATTRIKSMTDLMEVAISALQIDAKIRPTTNELSQRMAFASIKSQFWEIQEAFKRWMQGAVQPSSESSGRAISMIMWFEKQRLYAWGSALGLLGGPPRKQTLVEDWDRFARQAKRILSRVLSVVDVQRPSPTLESTDARTELISDTDDELRQAVQELWNLLPAHGQKAVERQWRHDSLSTYDTADLVDIEKISDTIGRPQYAEVSALAALRALNIAFSKNAVFTAQDRRLDAGDITVVETFGAHDIGIYQQKLRVLIEWTRYSNEWEQIPVEEQSSRINLIAEGLIHEPRPRDLRTLTCAGFFESKTSGNHGYGFVYPFPYPVEKPRSLREFLIRAKAPSGRQPLLGTKYRLASSLVSCLSEFHCAGWVHKEIHSGNIVFFADDTVALDDCLAEPYLIDLRSSRPDSEAWYSTPPSYDQNSIIYQHPEYQPDAECPHGRYRAIYDYYSIGCVLFEIGSWQPLKDIANANPSASPAAFRNLLISKYAPRLGPKMGAVYTKLVLACLNCSFAEGRDEMSPFMQFNQQVVEPVEELSGYCI